MAGVLGIYGLIVAVVINGNITSPTDDGIPTYSYFSSQAHLAAGLCCGLSSLFSGWAIGVAGDTGVRAVGEEERMFIPTIMIQVFCGNIGLFGLIVALILTQSNGEGQCSPSEY